MDTQAQYQDLIDAFIMRYLPRREVLHRLPLSVDIKAFWPVLENTRRGMSTLLPLITQEGESFWFVQNPSITMQVDQVSASARRETLLSPWVTAHLQEDAMIEEAVYSSLIEGAFTTREAAEKMLKSGRKPRNQSEQMVKNNYDALSFMLERLHMPISRDMLVQVAGILTRGTTDTPVTGFRTIQVVVAGQDEVVYTPPAPDQVSGMMDSLLDFIKTSKLHPVIKACIAHFYFVYVHPFTDGNGRTARALSLLILLQSGFDFFRSFPISSLVAKDRMKYYRAIRDVEDSAGDMTYFIDTYSAMLSGALQIMERQVTFHLLRKEWMARLRALGTLNERQLLGADWLLKKDQEQMTVNVWKKKFGTATETARQDLLTLSETGLLTRRMEGKKAVFIINRVP